VTLPAFAAERRAAAPLLLGARRPPLLIDISCLHGAQQQTRRTPRLWSMNGHTDRRTDALPTHRPRCAYYASQWLNYPTIGGGSLQARGLKG